MAFKKKEITKFAKEFGGNDAIGAIIVKTEEIDGELKVHSHFIQDLNGGPDDEFKRRAVLHELAYYTACYEYNFAMEKLHEQEKNNIHLYEPDSPILPFDELSCELQTKLTRIVLDALKPETDKMISEYNTIHNKK